MSIEHGRPGGQWMRVADAAAYCGLAVSTLNKWRVDGTGPRFVKLPRAIIYDRTDLDEWLGSRKVGSTSETPAA